MNFLMTIVCDAISADVYVTHDQELGEYIWKSFWAMLGFHSTPYKENKPDELNMKGLEANIFIIQEKLDEGLDICNSILPSRKDVIPDKITRKDKKLPTIVEESHQVKLYGKPLPYVSSATYLGFQITPDLSDDDSIQQETFIGYELLITKVDGPKILLSQPRRTSNSELFVQTRIDTFDARYQKLLYSFASRLFTSENAIVKLLLRSETFCSSLFWSHYCRLVRPSSNDHNKYVNSALRIGQYKTSSENLLGTCRVPAGYRPKRPMPARLLNPAGASRGYIPDGHRQVNDLLASAPLPAYLGQMPTWSRQRQ
ncbi:hypothetical protein Bbelb_154890 [Branchiostoma belcheri]|nr:hypothetical protein Bbelb_154890 [Branchiostoma belcheri]